MSIISAVLNDRMRLLIKYAWLKLDEEDKFKQLAGIMGDDERFRELVKKTEGINYVFCGEPVYRSAFIVHASGSGVFRGEAIIYSPKDGEGLRLFQWQHEHVTDDLRIEEYYDLFPLSNETIRDSIGLSGLTPEYLRRCVREYIASSPIRIRQSDPVQISIGN